MPLAVTGRRLIRRFSTRFCSQDSSCLRLCLVLWILFFIALSIGSIVLIFIFDGIYTSILNKKISLAPESETFVSWKDPIIPIHFSIYLYNITNKEEFENGKPPRLVEVGPYVYREKRLRLGVHFYNQTDPERLFFRHKIGYFFEPELSNGNPETDMIVQYYLPQAKASFLYALTTYTANQLMWGYEFDYFFGSKRIGLFPDSNMSRTFDFSIGTGVKNISDRGVVYELDGKDRFDTWDFTTANEFRGTDGSFVPPGLKVGDKVSLVVPRLCRSFDLYAIDTVMSRIHDQVELMVISGQVGNRPPPSDPAFPLYFCKDNSSCPPTGFISLSRCLPAEKDVGVILCPPHFYGVDPRYYSNLEGVAKPSEENDTSRVLVEPTTGMVMEAYNKMQINIEITHEHTGLGKEGETYYLPMGYTVETAIAGRPILNRLYWMHRLRDIIPLAVKITAALGGLLVLASCFLLYLSSSSSDSSDLDVGRRGRHRGKKGAVDYKQSTPIDTIIAPSSDEKGDREENGNMVKTVC